MLAMWLPGCRAYRFSLGDALCFPEPKILDCDSTLGLALCNVRGRLCSAELTSAEWAALPSCGLGLVLGAHPVGLRFVDAQVLDLSESIDIASYSLHRAYDLHTDTPTLRLPKLDGKTVRDVLGEKIPPQSKDGQAFLRRLKQEPGGSRDAGGLAVPRWHARSIKDGVVGMFFSALFRIVGYPASAPAQPAVAARQGAVKSQAWREKLARLAIVSRIGKLIGYRQGAYLRRMMRMFEQGNLDEALRNALPLDGLAQSLGQAFAAPKKRDSLRLSGRTGAAATIHLGLELQQHLRQMYRRAFEKFDRGGNIDEAVFVLAELLNARQEALDYLSKHHRHAQAAELALGWDMPAAMIVRLLMLAGDSTRAILVARRDGAFADAIHQLQEIDPKLAGDLRLEWGHALADGGDWLGAVNAVWSLAHAREQAIQWLLSAERAGEELSARALVQRAALLPETIEHYAAQVESIAAPGSPVGQRTAVAEAILGIRSSEPALRKLATCVLPAVAADRAVGNNSLSTKDLDKLLRLSNDAFLKADVPVWKTPAIETRGELWKRSTPMALDPPGAGLHRILDAVALPWHRYLVALGEVGALVVDKFGKIKQRYAVPAFKLVPAPSGQVALAVAPRERVSRIARLNLADHTIADLGTLPLQFAAPSYDGVGWTVVSENQILKIDVGLEGRQVLWHVGDLPGPIVAAGFFSTREIYLVDTAQGLQDWSYLHLGRRLQARTELRLRPELPIVVHPAGVVQQPEIRVASDASLEFCYQLCGQERRCLLTAGMPEEEFDCTFVSLDQGMVVGLHLSSGSRYFVVRFATNMVVAVLSWPSDKQVGVREQAEHLLFYDNEGRLLDVAIDRSTTRHISVL
jgi:hypothetical protein